MLNQARKMFSDEKQYYRLANHCYANAFNQNPSHFTANDMIHYAYTCYTSGLGYALLPEIRQHLDTQLACRVQRDRNFLELCFDIACKQNLSPDLDIKQYEKYIDSTFRIDLFLSYLIEFKRFDEAKQLLTRKEHLLSEKQYLKQMRYIESLASLKTYKILHDKEFIKAIYYSNKCYDKPLIIAFDAIDAHKRSEPFGVRFCIENGYDVLHFALASRTQYQMLDRESFRKIVSRVIKKYKGTICYGSSLGGYAALYYSDIFDSDVVALSPFDPYHPEITSKFNHVEHVDSICYQHNFIATKKTKGKVLITLDEKITKDKYFFDHIISKKFSDADILKADYTNHPITTILLKTDQLKHVILTAFNEKRWDVDFNIIQQCSYYYYSMYIVEKNLNRENAKTAILKALEIEVTKTYVAAAIKFAKAHKLQEMLEDLESKYSEKYPQLKWLD